MVDLKRKGMPLAILGLGLLGAVLYFSRRPRTSSAYFASGTFETTTLDLSVPLPVKVLRRFVQEGQPVQPGDTLMVLDTTDLALQYRSSVQTLRSLEARLRALDLTIHQLERDYQRLQSLENTSVPHAQVERTYTELLAKREERQALAAQKQATARQVERIRHQIQQLVLVSPVRAQVQTLYTEVEEYATPGWPLITLLPLDTLEFHTYVPQQLLPTLSVGDTVQISLDISETATITGWVQWIGAEAEYTPRNLQVSEERARLVYPVKVTVPNLDHHLRPGMTGIMKWGPHVETRRFG